MCVCVWGGGGGGGGWLVGHYFDRCIIFVCRVSGYVMSTRIEERFFDACERGELSTIRELAESQAVDINRVVDKRVGRRVRIGRFSYSTYGWTPLHHASA